MIDNPAGNGRFAEQVTGLEEKRIYLLSPIHIIYFK